MTIAETGHIGLNVVDLDRSKRFYQEVFGLEVGAESPDDNQRWAFLADNGRIVVTLWQQSSAPFAPDRAGLHHLSFRVDSVEEVRAAEARLRELGAELVYDGVVPHAEGHDSGGIFFLDPDGTRLEIYAPTGVGDQPAAHEHSPSCGFF